MKHRSLCIIWHEKEQGVDRVWHLRSIRPNGHIFGEVRDNLERNAKTITIVIGDEDRKKIFALADQIALIGPPIGDSQVRTGWLGLLASGTASDPQILLRYYPHDKSVESEHFLEIIKMLSPFLS